VIKAKEQAESEAILSALNSTHWNRKQAAVLLKIDYKALLYKMKKLGLDDEATPAADDSQDSERTFRSRQTD
jgi:DNA-binding NtrC family response regulator